MLWAAAEKDITLVCLGCYNKTTQTGSLYTAGLEAGSLWSRCWLIWFPVRGLQLVLTWQGELHLWCLFLGGH